MIIARLSLAAALCVAPVGCDVLCDRDYPAPEHKTYRFQYLVEYTHGGQTYVERPMVVCRHLGVRVDRGFCKNQWDQTLVVDGKALPSLPSLPLGMAETSRTLEGGIVASFQPGSCDSLAFGDVDYGSLSAGPVYQGPHTPPGGSVHLNSHLDHDQKAQWLFERSGVTLRRYRVHPVGAPQD